MSVIGDAVNIASRIEGLTKVMGATIIVSEPLYSRLPKKHDFIIRPLGKFRLMGKTIPVALGELMGTDDHSMEAKAIKEEILSMEKALLAFSSGKFSRAYKGFMDLFEQTQKYDRALGYQYMADYAKNLLDSGIPNDWDGSVQLIAK